MADCEANYMRIQRLFPCMDAVGQRYFQLPVLEKKVVKFSVIERCAYTDLLELSQGEDSAWLRVPTMRIRVYHDARLAEVISCDSQRSTKPRNAYPNDNMHQPDEKAQWNRFLAEWLSACLKYGHVTTVPFVCEEG